MKQINLLDMIQEIENDEQEYTTRKIWVDTHFKNNHYISDFENGFKALCFIGTRQEYDKAIEPYNNHNNGKIIGEDIYYSSEDWHKAHGLTQKTVIIEDENDAFLRRQKEYAKWKEEMRIKISQGYEMNRLEKLEWLGKL